VYEEMRFSDFERETEAWSTHGICFIQWLGSKHRKSIQAS